MMAWSDAARQAALEARKARAAHAKRIAVWERGLRPVTTGSGLARLTVTRNTLAHVLKTARRELRGQVDGSRREVNRAARTYAHHELYLKSKGQR